MVRRQLDLGAALTTSFEAIKRNPALAIGGIAIYFALSFAAQAIPVLNIPIAILVMPALAGGFVIFSLSVADNSDPKLENLFAGFQAYGKWMGVYWLWALIGAAACLPAGIAVLPIVVAERLHLSPALRGSIDVGCGIVAAGLIVGAIAFLVRYLFTYYVAVETAGIWDSFRGSEAITEGCRLQLFWMSIVLGLIAVAGAIGLVVGILFTYPLAIFAWAALYRQLNPRRQSQTMAEPQPEGPPITETPIG